MTATNAPGILRITCNACPAVYHHTAAAGEFRNFAEMVRADHWSVEKHAGAWQFCPACTKARKGGGLF